MIEAPATIYSASVQCGGRRLEPRRERSKILCTLFAILHLSSRTVYVVSGARNVFACGSRQSYNNREYWHCSSFRRTIPTAWIRLRGGSDDLPLQGENSLVDAHNDVEKELDANEEKFDEAVQYDANRNKRPFMPWLLGSLFDINNDIQSEATADTYQLGSAAPGTLSSSAGRGGALVREKAPSRFKWLSKLEPAWSQPTTSGSIQKDKLKMSTSETDLELTKSSQSTTTRISKSISSGAKLVGKPIADTVIASAKSVRKVWWVDTWADQLPTSDDERKFIEHELNATTEQVEATVTNDGGDVTTELIATRGNSSETTGLDDMESEPKSGSGVDDAQFSEHVKETDPTSKEKDEKIKAGDSKTKKKKTTKSKSKKKNKQKEAVNTKGEDSASPPPTPQEPLFAIDLPIVANASATVDNQRESEYLSTGYWRIIDNFLTLGYSNSHPDWRVSAKLRTVRKAAANVTGLHGALSGKPHQRLSENIDDEHLGLIRRRLAAIDRARRNIERASALAGNTTKHRRRFFWKKRNTVVEESDYSFVLQRSSKEEKAKVRRIQRVNEIDKQMKTAQKLLTELACEKDVLQRRHNPFWNYTIDEGHDLATAETGDDIADATVSTSRDFTFPPEDLLEEYLHMLFSSGRLTKLNHTDLWRRDISDEYDDEDELLSPAQYDEERKRSGSGNAGSWLLRNGIGEKIGEAAETAAYKGVCKALMSILARSISGLHGLNVMSFSDIRLAAEPAPDLPPISDGIIPGSGNNRNYAHDAIRGAIRKGARKQARNDNFIQLDAVVETLTSQCQIAAPLMKLFPLAWQRAILANIVTMATAIIADFCEGLEFQILGHKLAISFTPVTEEDMIRGMVRNQFNNPHRRNQDLFEAAVQATAEDVSKTLTFLDRWHERALGSGVLRTQIATLIARLVLTLVDDVLSGSRLDLWADQAGGPRLVAGLAYRTTPNYMDGAGGD